MAKEESDMISVFRPLLKSAETERCQGYYSVLRIYTSLLNNIDLTKSIELKRKKRYPLPTQCSCPDMLYIRVQDYRWPHKKHL